MKITEWMNDVTVDEEIIDKIGFRNNCNLSKKRMKERVFQKIGRENSNPFYVYGRRAIVVAACAVTVSALFGWNIIGNYGKRQETASPSANSFVLYAQAKEMKSSVPVLLHDSGFEGSMSSDEDGNASYDIVLPLYCEGDNIESITYKINQGVFKLADCPSAKSLVSKKEVPSDSEYSAYLEDGDVICTEFTIGYDTQVKPGGVTRFIHMVGEKNIQHADAIGNNNIKEKKLMLDELFKDLVIECTVNFNDGSTQSKKIHTENKIMTFKEACQGRETAFPNRKNAFITLICE